MDDGWIIDEDPRLVSMAWWRTLRSDLHWQATAEDQSHRPTATGHFARHLPTRSEQPHPDADPVLNQLSTIEDRFHRRVDRLRRIRAERRAGDVPVTSEASDLAAPASRGGVPA